MPAPQPWPYLDEYGLACPAVLPLSFCLGSRLPACETAEHRQRGRAGADAASAPSPDVTWPRAEHAVTLASLTTHMARASDADSSFLPVTPHLAPTCQLLCIAFL